MTTMIDCTSTNQPEVLRRFGAGQNVAGYVTGSGGIEWSELQFAQFTRKIRIAQSAAPFLDDESPARCLDVERYAATPDDWPGFWRSRTNKAVAMPYCSLLTVPQILAACSASGIDSPSRWWLAWWPQMPVPLEPVTVLDELERLTGVTLLPSSLWAWQHANFPLWDVSAVFGTPDFSRR